MHWQFDIEGRVAYVCTSILVTCMYCSGMPILLWFNLLGLTITFYADKWLLLRCFRQPPDYNASIPMTIAQVLRCTNEQRW